MKCSSIYHFYKKLDNCLETRCTSHHSNGEEEVSVRPCRRLAHRKGEEHGIQVGGIVVHIEYRKATAGRM